MIMGTEIIIVIGSGFTLLQARIIVFDIPVQ